MNTIRKKRIQPGVSFATRSKVKSSPMSGNRAQRAAQLESLKARLLRQQVMNASDMMLIPAIRWAAHEATALAWLTPFPLLLLPTLLDEKVGEAKRVAGNQERIWHKSQELLALAA